MCNTNDRLLCRFSRRTRVCVICLILPRMSFVFGLASPQWDATPEPLSGYRGSVCTWPAYNGMPPGNASARLSFVCAVGSFPAHLPRWISVLRPRNERRVRIAPLSGRLKSPRLRGFCMPMCHRTVRAKLVMRWRFARGRRGVIPLRLFATVSEARAVL